MKILVVEDNEDSRILLMKQLRAHGYEVMAAADGVEALQQALAEPPNIIISDIMMPNMDGYQLCQECKQNDKLRDIPFVFYTATYTKEEDEKLALSLGANTFIRKPTEPDVLVQMLSEIVEKAQSGTLAPPEAALLEPSLFLTEYNKRIVAKLEEKMAQLEESEEKLKQTAEEWATTFDSITDLVSICDKDFRLIRVNKTFADAFKATPEELIGKPCYEIFHNTNEPIPNCPHEKTMMTKKPAMIEYFEPQLGIHIEVATSPIFDEKGEVTACVRVARDITHRKQAEEELSRLYEELKTLNLELEERVKERTSQLEQAVQAAEVASRAKSDFLASMSHELRTPLNAVIGFSQVLQEQYFGKLNQKQSEYVTDILESGQHLLSLINDILDLAKIEAGKMELELSKVIIKDLLGSSLIMIKEKALAHRISLDIDTTGNLEYLKIMVDERRVKQVMFNLLSNAVKFTPDGGAIRVEGKKEGKELVISVSDTGIGLTPEKQEKVFEEFYQTNSAIQDKTPGTGLGLSVAKSIVEMHGGRIWVESEGPDKGSRFTFTLPI